MCMLTTICTCLLLELLFNMLWTYAGSLWIALKGDRINTFLNFAVGMGCYFFLYALALNDQSILDIPVRDLDS